MYFRTKTTRTGKALQLIESFRSREGKPRQRIVVSLGDLHIPKEERREAVRLVEEALYHGDQPHLIAPDTTPQMLEWVDYIVKRVEREGRWSPAKGTQSGRREAKAEGQPSAEGDEDVIDGVIANRVGHTHTTTLGPLLIGLHFWKKLGMPELLEQIGFNERQRKAAAALVLNRLDNPVSEHAMPEWLAGTSLPDLLGEGLGNNADDIFYRTGDHLLASHKRIESHLRGAQSRMFNLDRTILLYDLTNTHFEGVAEANDKARRGCNKQKRNDCPQVVIGMVFDEFGFELAHQTFKGNTNDADSLVSMLEQLHASTFADDLAAESRPLVVMDAGVATAKNRRLLRQKNFNYLVSNARPCRKQWAEDFQAEDFTEIKGRENSSPVQVRMRDSVSQEKQSDGTVEEVSERLVFCRSAGRFEKEQAIRSRAEDRFLAELQKLRKRVESGRLKSPEKIQRAIGRKCQQNPRAAKYYDVKLTEKDGRKTIQWKRSEEAWQKEEELFGCYVLRTNQYDFSAEQLWQLYMTLTQAEEGFRMLKSDLGLRPNFHQREERVDAHIFITVLAHQILNAVIHTLRQAGDTRSWPTVKRIMQTHCYTTVLLPTVDGSLYRIRRAGQAEAEQQRIYENLGVKHHNLPKSKTRIKT